MGITVSGGRQLGIQSYTFRAIKEWEALASAVQECGLDALEICFVHVDPKNKQQVDDCIKFFNTKGIKLTSYGIGGFGADESEVAPVFEFAQKAGIKVLGADLNPVDTETIVKYCKKYGIKLAIHNHGRNHHLGKIEQVKAVVDKGEGYVGLCLDTAHAIDAYEDPAAFAKTFIDVLYGVHVKDTDYDKEGKRFEPVIGKGLLKLETMKDILVKAPNIEYFSIEYEGSMDVSSLVGEVKECIAHITNKLGK